MKLNRYCFHVSISSEDQKKKDFTENLKSFCPQNQVKTEKKRRSSPKIEEFLSPKASEDQKIPKINQRSDADQSQIIEGM